MSCAPGSTLGFSKRAKQEVSPATSKDGFTVVRKTNVDPPLFGSFFFLSRSEAKGSDIKNAAPQKRNPTRIGMNCVSFPCVNMCW